MHGFGFSNSRIARDSEKNSREYCALAKRFPGGLLAAESTGGILIDCSDEICASFAAMRRFPDKRFGERESPTRNGS